MARVLAVALLLPLLGGCIADIIAPPQDTTRNFACGVLNPERYDRFDLILLEEHGMALDLLPALGVLADRLDQHTPRQLNSIYMLRDSLPEARSWTPDELLEAYGGEGFTTRGRILLHVMIVERIDDVAEVGVILQPGLVAFSAAAIRNASAELGVPRGDLVPWVVLHYAGHALGVVNAGIPMQENHEGLPKHEADPDSVMHHTWHNPSTRPSVPPGLPDYSPAVVDDWQASVGGVCA